MSYYIPVYEYLFKKETPKEPAAREFLRIYGNEKGAPKDTPNPLPQYSYFYCSKGSAS